MKGTEGMKQALLVLAAWAACVAAGVGFAVLVILIGRGLG